MNNRVRSRLASALAFLGIVRNNRFKRRKLRAIILTITIVLSITTLFPVGTVKGLVTTTPISPQAISIDDNRIVGLLNPSTAGFFVYDIASSTSATIGLPVSGGIATGPEIFGNKVVVAAGPPGLLSPMTLYYCVLPQAAVATACPVAGPGSWTSIASGLPGVASLSLWGFPTINRDLVVWPVSNGFSYLRFSSGTTTTVAVPTIPSQPSGVSTNGAIISLVSGGTLWYVDTTDCVGPCTPTPVNTGLPAVATLGGTSISQNIIAFMEPGAANRIRYFDVNSGLASAAGAGPLGTLGFLNPAIWNDRIAFTVSETDLGFDCGGVAGIQSNERCMRYWNINGPGWVVPLLAPDAAPPVTQTSAVIYDKVIAFVGPGGALQYVRVPMQGDVNLDGKVTILDLAISALCFDAVLKGITC